MQRLGAYRLAVSLFGLTDLAALADSIVDQVPEGQAGQSK